MLGFSGMWPAVANDTVETAVEQNVQMVEVTYPHAIVLSVLILVAVFFAARCKKIALGPSLGKSFNHAMLTLGVFLSVLVFNIALSTYVEMTPLGVFLGKVFDTLQLMLANKEIQTFASESLGSGRDGLVCYEMFVYLVALFTDTTPRLKAMWRSVFRDTYLITPLGDQTLALAKSIRGRCEDDAGDGSGKRETRRANIVFTDCSKDEGTSLADRAYDMGAICVHQTIAACAFARAEGLRTPTVDELQTYASVFWDDADSYRSDEAGLHARLVSYDDLSKACERWREVCTSGHGDNGENNKSFDVGFQKRNDEHVRVEP